MQASQGSSKLIGTSLKPFPVAPEDMNDITPFWQRIPAFFLYPLKGSAPVMLISCSLLLMVVPRIPFFGVLFGIVVVAVSFKYAYTILEETAHGNLVPPALGRNYWTEDYSILFKQLFIFVFLGASTEGITNLLGGMAGIMYYLLAALLVPASIITLATSNSLLAAINPFYLSRQAYLIGWPYLVLYAFLFFLMTGRETALYLVGDASPTLLQTGLMILISTYFIYVMYFMMGYLIYQYHEKLGFSPYLSSESNPEGAADNAMHYEGMELVDQHIENEYFVAAQEELKAIIGRYPEDTDLRMKLHKVMKLSGDTRQLARYGRELITLFLNNNKSGAAVEVFLDCIDADQDFRPGDIQEYLTLVELLRMRRRYSEALALTNDIHLSHPGNTAVPVLYFTAARILAEDLQQDKKAKQILAFLSENYPENPLGTEISSYMAALG